jgi:rhodanese-related sulfurtransferase
MRTPPMTVAPEPETMPLAEVLREMDLAFVAAGDHSMTVEEAVKFIDHPHFVLLDVRTPQELTRLAFPFALHIPLQELPDRLSELPDDKFFITFCFNGSRAILAYAFLRTQGFDEIKALEGRVQELADAMSPGKLNT